MGDNRVLPKPIPGIAYVPLRSPGEQAQTAAAFLANRYSDGRTLILGINALVADLEPNSDPARIKAFEQAVCDLGQHLGLAAQRPERDTGNGPDDLWIGSSVALVIECKSGSTADTIPRSDVAQLGHSMDWFTEKYPGFRASDVTPVLIHPARRLNHDAVAPPDTQVITFDRLAGLRGALRRFATSVADGRTFADPEAVGRRLVHEHLNDRAFIPSWGQRPHSAR